MHVLPTTRAVWAPITATTGAARSDSAVLRWSLSPGGDPALVHGQFWCCGVTVAMDVPAQGADNVALDIEDSGGLPLPTEQFFVLVWVSSTHKKNFI